MNIPDNQKRQLSKNTTSFSERMSDMGLALRYLHMMGYPYNIRPNTLDAYTLDMAEDALKRMKNPNARGLLKTGLEKYRMSNV